MAQSVVTRSQRRIERKQAYLILLLVLGVAVASFALGYSVGRRGGDFSMLTQDQDKPHLPIVSQAVPPPPAEAEPAAEPQLTFYDNLPKGAQAPLGSGINLPARPAAPVAQQSAPKVDVPAPQPAPAVPVPVAARPDPATAPQVAPTGDLVVQVASFRAEEDARKLVVRLQKLDLTAFVERADLGDKGVWFRVLAGPYAERETADRVAGRLQAEERFSVLVRRR